ncbi:MAG TPA: hypothetical protein VF198_15340 [Vicinamibacterales bacterium]
MAVTRRIGRWWGMRASRRLARSVPFAGAIVALLLVRQHVRQKGLRNGVLNAGLDAIPFVGAAKNLLEMITGDLIPDRRRA